MNFLKRNFLLFVVFLTGASVLIIEVTAVRILSPFYGNTIFTMSSIITIILAALSFGYYIGGKLADKRPSILLFFLIIFLSGCSLLFLHVFGLIILPLVSMRLSILSGPLLSSIFLFLIPSLLLGTLSPFVIKLQSEAFPDRGVGTLSGQIFFWSTLGSITGSLLTGFVFIPNFGVNEIVIVNSILLFALGIVPVAVLDKEKKYIYKIIIPVFLFVLFAMLGKSIGSIWKKNFVYNTDTMYQNISVTEGTWKNDRDIKALAFSGNGIQSAVYLDEKDPTDLVFDYTKYYSLYNIFNPTIKNILVIGGGAYTVPRAFLYDLPEATVDVSEVDTDLYDIAKKYFFLKDDKRLMVSSKDGRRFLQDSTKKYDFIFADAYGSSLSIPSHLATNEFFKLSKSKLNDKGVFVANIIGSLSRQKPSFLFSEIKTFKKTFPNSYFFAVKSTKQINAQNIIFVGLNSNEIFDFNSSDKISFSKYNFSKTLPQKIINMNRFDLSSDAILTDDYVPVDYMNRNMKNIEKRTEKEMMMIIKQQLDLGPRFLGSKGHERVQKMIISEMKSLTDDVIVQEWTHNARDSKKYKLKNIIGKINPQKKQRILIAAHYDSKKLAHMDNKSPTGIMPGANDSGSGVAVLFDIAREIAIKKDKMNIGVDFVFFDGEEGENIGGDFSHYEAIGSKYFAKNIQNVYSNNEEVSGIVIDMVADKDFQILKEPNSLKNSEAEMNKFWKVAKTINDNVFKDETYTGVIEDDHISLNKINIPTFLLIDRDYKYWHTTKDTFDKCSGKSMKIISDSVVNYLNDVNNNVDKEKS